MTFQFDLNQKAYSVVDRFFRTRHALYLPSALMSALGQKQTFGLINAMSALPPKTDIG